jgi:amidophosphoribosyltransferase
MRAIIGADSLAFLSIEGLYQAMGEPGRNPERPQFTDHCFTGEYPIPLIDRAHKGEPEHQLSLLAASA